MMTWAEVSQYFKFFMYAGIHDEFEIFEFLATIYNVANPDVDIV